MKRCPILLFLLFVLTAATLSAALPNAVTVKTTTVDADHVTITGDNFGASAPVVKLAGIQLVVETFSAATQTIVANLPGVMDPGTYLLTVSTGNGVNQTAQVDLTIGAAGPQGPQGEQGEQGPPGPPGIALPFSGTVLFNGTAFVVRNQSGSGGAIRGVADGTGNGVRGMSAAGAGVSGSGNTGVQASGTLTGLSATGAVTGVVANGSTAVEANGGAIGVQASGAIAVLAQGTSLFNGDVNVSGVLSKSAGSFKIDHPLDPENKFLSHSFVESPDMMNIYNGNAVLDGDGEAIVELPEWFEALNRDFRYQLTPIGSFAPLFIAQKVSGNRFRIGGGKPGMEVSWQVTGIRHDAFANAHRIPVEERKEQPGYYLHPELFGQGKERAIYAKP